MSALKYWHDDPSLQSGGEWRYVTIPMVGQPVHVERYGGFATSDITTSTPTQFGDSIIIPNPGMAVAVEGLFTGYIYHTTSANVGSAAVRVEISFDGGSTWENGNAEYGTAWDSGFVPISAQFAREGVPTGDIHVRVMVMDYTGIQMRVAGSSELVAKMYGGPVVLDNRYQIADDTGWIDATLENGWANYGSSFVPARYRKKNGVVYVQGFVSPASATNIIVFRLPVEMRPDLHFYTSNGVDGGFSNVRVDVLNSGYVRLNNYVSGAAYVGFNISFPVG